MRIHLLTREQRLYGESAEIFAFFASAANLERITPPRLHFAIMTPLPIEMRRHTLIAYRLRLHGIPIRWLTEIREWTPPHRFVDVALRSPYAVWHHTHEFTQVEPGVTLMRDTVRYALPLGPLGELALGFVRRELEVIFDHRAASVPFASASAEPG